MALRSSVEQMVSQAYIARLNALYASKIQQRASLRTIIKNKIAKHDKLDQDWVLTESGGPSCLSRSPAISPVSSDELSRFTLTGDLYYLTPPHNTLWVVPLSPKWNEAHANLRGNNLGITWVNTQQLSCSETLDLKQCLNVRPFNLDQLPDPLRTIAPNDAAMFFNLLFEDEEKLFAVSCDDDLQSWLGAIGDVVFSIERNSAHRLIKSPQPIRTPIQSLLLPASGPQARHSVLRSAPPTPGFDLRHTRPSQPPRPSSSPTDLLSSANTARHVFHSNLTRGQADHNEPHLTLEQVYRLSLLIEAEENAQNAPAPTVAPPTVETIIDAYNNAVINMIYKVFEEGSDSQYVFVTMGEVLSQAQRNAEEFKRKLETMVAKLQEEKDVLEARLKNLESYLYPPT